MTLSTAAGTLSATATGWYSVSQPAAFVRYAAPDTGRSHARRERHPGALADKYDHAVRTPDRADHARCDGGNGRDTARRSRRGGKRGRINSLAVKITKPAESSTGFDFSMGSETGLEPVRMISPTVLRLGEGADGCGLSVTKSILMLSMTPTRSRMRMMNDWPRLTA